MRKLILLFALLLGSLAFGQITRMQVGMIIEVTTIQRDALTIAATEFPIIYNTTTNQHERYNGSSWERWQAGTVTGDITDGTIDILDLDAALQTTAGLADSAIQTIPTHTGEVTGGTALTIAVNAVETTNILDATIDEADLDVSTNASLDLADSAIQDNIAVSSLADGTDGELITWDAAGAPAVIAVGTATHVLTSNGVGVAPTFQAAAGGGSDELGSDGDKGDFTVSGGSGLVANIDNSVIETANILNETILGEDIFNGTIGTVDIADNAIDSDRILNGAVNTVDIEDDTILEIDLDATNAPTDNYLLSYNAAGTNFTWVVGSGYEILVTDGLVASVNSALQTANGVPVRATATITNAAVPIVVPSGQTFYFNDITVASSFTGTAVITNETFLGSDRDIIIKGGLIDGSANTTDTYDAVRLDSVTKGRIEGIIAKEIEITASGTATGNFRLIQSDSILIKDVVAYDTWRMGIYITDGVGNTIDGGFFNGTHDSGIGVVDSDYGVITNVVVDSCGTSDASNITANMRHGKFINNTSINAPGTNNGNGFTLGHASGYDAYNTVVSGNVFSGNAAKGIYLQGTNTDNNIITDNIIISNGVGSGGANSGGISIATGSGNTFSNNTIIGNKHGISIVNGSGDNIIRGNDIEDSTTGYGIQNDGQYTRIENNYLINHNLGDIVNDTNATFPSIIGNFQKDGSGAAVDIQRNFTIKAEPSADANVFSTALLTLKGTSQGSNTLNGIAMGTSFSGELYGITTSTKRLTGATDFEYSIRAHKNSDVGTEIFKLDDVGNMTIAGTVDGIDIATDVAANTAKTTNATHTGEVTGATALTIATSVVDSDNIVDDSIQGIDLEATNSPTDGHVPAYDSSTGGFTWEASTAEDVAYASGWDGDADATSKNTIWDAKFVQSDTLGTEVASARQIENMVSMTQADYDLLTGGQPDADWLYVITDAKHEYKMIIPLGAVGEDIVVADDLTHVPVLDAITITRIEGDLLTAPTGAGVTFDIELDDGTPASIFSTLLTVDATERFSSSAATPAVISDATIPADSFLTFNIDVIGSSVAGADATITIYYTID